MRPEDQFGDSYLQPEHDRMTQGEAEAVIAMWSKVQGEKDVRATMPSTAELAEVLGASQDDVRLMLQRVRTDGAKVVKRPDVEKEKRRSSFVFWSLGVGSLLLVAIIPVFALLSFGRNEVVHAQPVAVETFANYDMPVLAPNVQGGAFQQQLPSDVTVIVDGVSVQGEGPNLAVSRLLEEPLKQTVLDQYWKWVSAPQDVGLAMSGAELRAKLLDGESVDGIADFVETEIKLGSESKKALLPVALSSDPKVKEVVQGVLDEVIGDLTQWAVQTHQKADFWQ